MTPTEPTTPQNSYDDPDFFAGYATLRENPFSANAVLVDPTRDALLPSLAGKRVLDLGCGTGDFCRAALERGAASVTGVDISERMLTVAAAYETDARLHYIRSPLETFTAPPASADVIVSILALHYIADITPIFARAADALVPGGAFVFCVEHPIATARCADAGWIKNEAGARLHWAIDDYAREGIRHGAWIIADVPYYHRTLATYLNAVLEARLRITAVAEPTPDDDTVAARPAFADARRRPLFLFIRAEKP